MSKQDVLINFNGQGLKRCGVGESFTIPSSTSRTSSALLFGSALNTQVPTVGGQIFALYTDLAQASPEQNAIDFHYRLEVGDVVAVGAVVGGYAPLSVNGAVVYQIPCTAVGGVLLVWA